MPRADYPDRWCPNPYQWLDITIDFTDYAQVGFAICSQCWADEQCVLGRWKPARMAQPDFYDELLSLWNSERVRAIREAMWSRFPSMCRGCSRLAGGSDPPVAKSRIDEDPQWRTWRDAGATETFPRVVSLNYDPSCNLACPMCRAERQVLRPADGLYGQLAAFQRHTVRRLMPGLQWLHASGYGDPFASTLYQDLLTRVTPDEAPHLRYCFLTNGLGFTRHYYETMPTRDRIEQMNVSIDAAYEATYRAIRGGSWPRLRNNLAFMAELRRQGGIRKFSWGFVLQAANWRELPAFLADAADHGVDNVTVYTLLKHGFNREQYDRAAVHEPYHPDHAGAMDVLEWARQKSPVGVYVEVANPDRAGQKQ